MHKDSKPWTREPILVLEDQDMPYAADPVYRAGTAKALALVSAVADPFDSELGITDIPPPYLCGTL